MWGILVKGQRSNFIYSINSPLIALSSLPVIKVNHYSPNTIK